MSVLDFLEKTDWKLLRKQKQDLVMITPFKDTETTKSIDGIINFLDQFQEMAAEYLGEDKVFNTK